jgi:hypothetical protein
MPPSEIDNIKKIRSQLSALKRSRRFIPWNESAEFAGDLEFLAEKPASGRNMIANAAVTGPGSTIFLM